ncbi:MAG: HAMP domain-containing protein [Phycisphaeraceae bacterium]
MLRRKLMLLMVTLTALLMVLAVAALWSLQSILADLDHINTHSQSLVDQTNQISAAIARVELTLNQLRSGQTRRLDDLIQTVNDMQANVTAIGGHYCLDATEIEPVCEQMAAGMVVFQKHVAALATTEDPGLSSGHSLRALDAAVQLRQAIFEISRHAHQQAQREQEAMSFRFRWLVIGIGLGFLLVINLSVLLLMRWASMILAPVDRLVQASRELGQEHFAFRVQLRQNDEFDELARAYNQLAAALEENEERKIEMLGQVARTLNHELNNAGAIIELQLSLLRRRADPASTEKCLRQIRENLARMTRVVEALKHVRRIVLTDYVEGVKMLDLERSIQADEPAKPESVAADERG